MKNLLTGFMVVFAAALFAQGGNVTFVVDMSQYAGSEVLADSNVYVNGTFNGWCGACWPMGDPDGDMIYEATFLVPSDTSEFKFTINGWNDQENFLGGESCTVTNFGFTNRSLIISGDTTLNSYCFQSCEACGVGPAPGNVTLTVDMNDYQGSQVVGDSSVFVSGAFNGWCGDCNMMAANGDGTYTTTVSMPGGLNEYKFTINNWADQEVFNGSEDCTGPPAEFVNRQLDVDGDVTVSEVCFGACVTCAEAGDPGNITFTVDMNQYEGPEILGDSSLFISGTFNGWCGDCNMLTHNGDGTYTGTVFMPAGQNEYKFQINAWADQENFVGGEECTLTTGGFTNRIVQVDGDATEATVCFASCDACAAACTLADTAPVDLTKSQQPVDGVIDRAQVKWYKASPQVKYSASDNTAADIEFWPIRDLSTNTPITDGDTTLLSKRTKPGKDLFKWPVKYNRSDIDPNTRYSWRVRVYCDAGDGAVSPWSDIKIFNTPDFDPVTGIYTPPPGAVHTNGDWKMLAEGLSFSVFPNPNNGENITIQLDADIEGVVNVAVYNISGELVMSTRESAKGQLMNLEFDNALPNGMYFLQVESNGLQTNGKFIVR